MPFVALGALSRASTRRHGVFRAEDARKVGIAAKQLWAMQRTVSSCACIPASTASLR